MTERRAIAQSASFVPARPGHRFRLVSEPAEGEARGTIVLVHAFAEEMNKSRRMTARMARLFAADGWRVVQRDLLGCGDSSGEFGDATWEAWLEDVHDELDRAVADRPVWLWCVRAGALLAPAALADRPNVDLLLWQPVVAGAQHLQQFLRLHAGARIVGTKRDDADASPLQSLRSGSAVEVGGYWLNPALARGLEASTFDVPRAHRARVRVLEVSGDAEPQPSPAVARAVGALRERGHAVELQCVRGPAFWQTQEIEECEELLDETLRLC
jgi:exosortase A-associated hydrolase 2